MNPISKIFKGLWQFYFILKKYPQGKLMLDTHNAFTASRHHFYEDDSCLQIIKVLCSALKERR